MKQTMRNVTDVIWGKGFGISLVLVCILLAILGLPHISLAIAAPFAIAMLVR